MSKMKLFFKRLLIYIVVIIVMLPVSLFASINVSSKAHAATKTIESKTSYQKPVKQVDKKVINPALSTQKGLREEYTPGESIVATFVFTGKVTSAWVDLSYLDPNFPKKIDLTNQGEGDWKLVTPKLSRDLYVGMRTLTVFAKNNTSDVTIKKSYQVKLHKVKIVPLQITQKITQDSHLYLAWSKLKPTYNYTILIKNIHNGKVLKIVTQNSQITATLEPGNSYNIELSVSIPKTGEIVGTASSMVVMPGQIEITPAPEVKQVKKEIGQGVSTSSEKVKGTQSQKVTTPTPIPSPSSSPKGEEEKEGWSRLLVALAILVIAAGAAIGGYYGYEWYAGRGDDKSEPRSDSRW